MQLSDQTAPQRGSEALLDALNELSPGRIYTVAPRGEILDAMTLIRRNPLRDIIWSHDRSTLNIEVADQRISEVSISISEGVLTFDCDCGMRSCCCHVVVALVTLKKLMSPGSFKEIPLTESYLAELSGFLFGNSEAGYQTQRTSRFRLLVEQNHSGLSIRPWNGSHPATRLDPGLTKRESRFLEMIKLPPFRERIVQFYLESMGADARILLRQGDAEIPLQFFHDSVRETKTLIDLTEGVVTAYKVFEDTVPLADDSFASTNYYFDIPAKRIEPIANCSGWSFWNEVSQASAMLPDRISRNNRRITMGVREFNHLGLSFPADSVADSLILTIHGAPATVERRALFGEIHLTASECNSSFTLSCCMAADETVYPLSAWPFGMLSENEKWRFSAPLRAKKRFTVFADACFALLHCTTAKEENSLLKAAFSGDSFLKRKVASEAKRFAKAFANSSHGSSPMLLTDGNRWISYSMDRREQARLLEIPFRMFGASAFSGSTLPGEICVSRGELLPRLQELQSIAEAGGFRMLFNGRTVRSVTWDITLDATRSSIDWFELKPEVKCEGTEVTRKEMEEALTGGGIYLKGGEFVMLDIETSGLLAIFPRQAKSRKRSDQVRIPRLQILDWLHLRSRGVKVRLSPEDERVFSSLSSFDELPAKPLPERIDATLRHYQVDGYNWLAFLYEHRFGACLADDMGLGKTLQAITLLAGLHEGKITSHTGERLPHLIVVPPSLLFNWESEIARFYPDLKIATYRGTDRTTDFSGSDVVLTSYGIVQRDAEKLAGQRFNVIVFDEAQAVKNIQTETTGACRRLKGLFSLTLTGTPVENHLGEYYSVMDISVPGLLGEYETFRRGMNNSNGSFLEMLIRRTRPFILRRSKKMISSELPPKIETDIYLELTDRQRSLYTRTIEEVKSTVDEAYRNKTAGQARIIALTAILRLRQLCLSPEILIPSSKESSPKIEFLLEQLEELFDEGHSVLVFSQFTRFLDIVEKRLGEKKLNYLRLDGSTEIGERKKLVGRFQKSDEPSAFLLSLKAGGKGLNLTRATYVFHLDPWWNPAVEDQASDRAHRIGQTAQVTITRLVMRHTIEEKMMELKKRKLSLYKALLEDATTGGVSGISREDFDFLLG